MIKYAIKLHGNHKQGHLIFHAVPERPTFDDYMWQWYLTNKKGVLGNPIEGYIYESFVITTEQIKKENLDGMYLYAECLNKHTKEMKRTEFVRLSSNIEEIINLNSPFDKLSIYDKKGNVIDNP